MHCVSVLSSDGAPADVAAVKTFRKSDGVHAAIGERLRCGDIAGQRGDIEHPAAVGQQLALGQTRAGVRDADARDGFGLFNPFDDAALFWRRRIAFCGQHGQRGFGRQMHGVGQAAFGAGEQQPQKIVLSGASMT